MELLFFLGGFFVLIPVGYVAGRAAERRHLASLAERERALRGISVAAGRGTSETAFRTLGLVQGSVVIGQDYFLAVATGFAKLLGGRLRPYEGLYVRARREAVLRLKADAAARGADAVLNIRFVTMNIASLASGSGITGVEIVAYGTAVQSPAP